MWIGSTGFQALVKTREIDGPLMEKLLVEGLVIKKGILHSFTLLIGSAALQAEVRIDRVPECNECAQMDFAATRAALATRSSEIIVRPRTMVTTEGTAIQKLI